MANIQSGSFIDTLLSFYPSGLGLVDKGDLLALAQAACGAKSGITALAGGGQTIAAAQSNVLGPGINEVSVVATNNDSVILPLALAGLSVDVINDGASTLKIWGQPSNAQNALSAADTIADHSSAAQTNNGVTIGAGGVGTFFCFVSGKWKLSLGS